MHPVTELGSWETPQIASIAGEALSRGEIHRQGPELVRSDPPTRRRKWIWIDRIPGSPLGRDRQKFYRGCNVRGTFFWGGKGCRPYNREGFRGLR